MINLKDESNTIIRRKHSKKCIKISEMGIFDFSFCQLMYCIILALLLMLFVIFFNDISDKIHNIIIKWIQSESFSVFEKITEVINAYY